MPFGTPDFYKKVPFIIFAFLIIIGYIKYRQEKDPLKVFAYLLSREVLAVTALILLALVAAQILLNLLKLL